MYVGLKKIVFSGNHWTMEIIFLLLNNCDFELARTVNVSQKQFQVDMAEEGNCSSAAIDSAADDLKIQNNGRTRILKVHTQAQFIRKQVQKYSISLDVRFTIIKYVHCTMYMYVYVKHTCIQ